MFNFYAGGFRKAAEKTSEAVSMRRTADRPADGKTEGKFKRRKTP